MSSDENLSFAGRFLRKQTELRNRVLKSAEFKEWFGGFKHLDIDGERLYVCGGDMLKDQDELILEWARREHLVSEEEINRCQIDDEEQS